MNSDASLTGPPSGGTKTSIPVEPLGTSLARSRPWVLVLALSGLLGSGLLFLIGLALILVTVVPGELSTTRVLSLPLWMLGGLHWLVIPVVLWPALELLKLSNRIAAFIQNGRAAELEAALRVQYRIWKLWASFVLATFGGVLIAVLGAVVWILYQAM